MYPYYFTFTTFTKGRWVGEKILEVFGREFRAHPVEEYVSGSNQYLIFSLLRHSKPLELLLSSGEMYPRWNADGQLRAGGRGLQAEAQRPARQHRPQVPNPITGTVLFTLPSRNLSSLSGTRPRCCPSPSTSSISPRTWSSWTSPARSRLVLYSTLQLLPRTSNVRLLSTQFQGASV